MPRTLTEEQELLASGQTLSRITVAILRTFSDFTAQTVSNTYYLATAPTYFKLDGVVRQFKPFLLSVGDTRLDMDHLPAHTGGDGSVRKGLTVELSNGDGDAPSVVELRRSGGPRRTL